MNELADGSTSWADLARLLDAKAPRAVGEHYGHTQVKRMVSLRVYLGEVGQGGDTIDVRNRRAHPPLVDLRTWRSVQTVEKGRVKRAAEPFRLSGLVYCAGCSYRMGGGTIPQTRKVWAATGDPVASGARTDRAGADEVVETVHKVRVYRCPGKRGTGRCGAPSVILADALEAAVEEQAAPILAALGTARIDHEAASQELRAIEAQIAEADDALLELASLDMKRELGEDWTPMMRQLRREKDELIHHRDAVGADVEASEQVSLADLEPEERDSVLRAALGAVFVRRAPRGAPPKERVLVIPAGDELPPLGGPTNRIRPTLFRGFDDDAGARVA